MTEGRRNPVHVATCGPAAAVILGEAYPPAIGRGAITVNSSRATIDEPRLTVTATAWKTR